MTTIQAETTSSRHWSLAAESKRIVLEGPTPSALLSVDYDGWQFVAV
jgi:hypothetical protein